MIRSLACIAALPNWLMVMSVTAGPALAQNVVGAAGGQPFEARCAQGEIMIGVATRAGAMIDAIAPICATAFNSVQIDPSSKRTYPQYFGGGGGQPLELICPAGHPVVVGIYVSLERDGRIPDGLSLECKLNTNASLTRVEGEDYSDISAAERERIEPDGISQSYYAPVTRCPPRHVAVGINGATGRWLNRLGVICAYPVEHNPSLSERVHDGISGRDSQPNVDANQVLEGPKSVPSDNKIKGMERNDPGKTP